MNLDFFNTKIANRIKTFPIFAFLLGMSILSFGLNLSSGSTPIPLDDFINVLLDKPTNATTETIVLQFRLPKAITAVCVGVCLSVSGLMMQTLFRNPLAGPYVLGINSGASLGVATCILGASVFPELYFLTQSKWSIALAAALGSFSVLLAVLVISKRVRDQMSILIIGIMFASITSAIVSILSYFSSAEALQHYIFWGFGSLGNLSWEEVAILVSVTLTGLLLTVSVIKGLNSLLLGETYAQSMGQSLVRNRRIIILATSLLCGVVTAFVGPIAFVGLAAPHLTKQLLRTTNHRKLLLGSTLLGASMMLICDSFTQFPKAGILLPINAITALIGAPVVISLLLKRKRMYF